MRRQRRKMRSPRKHWLPASKRAQLSARCAQRFYFHDPEYAQMRADEGRALENRIRNILDSMLARKEILGFEAFAPHSQEDLHGFDFEVALMVESAQCKARFGITSSFRCLKRYFANHPGQECVLLDPNASDEEIGAALIAFVERIAKPIYQRN